MSNTHHTKFDHSQSVVTIREANGGDDDVLVRLAGLDSSRAPARPVLMAEVDGATRAAISLLDGSVVADPFHRTDDLVAMLRLHAGLTAATAGPRVGSLGRTRRQSRSPRPSSPTVPGIPVLPVPR